ncbi:MAG TPA: N-acetylmuramoyl-L-alanine amidase [Rhizomicrobium sp.]|jgi:N-acetylmuramoyl-L-alanine amidase
MRLPVILSVFAALGLASAALAQAPAKPPASTPIVLNARIGEHEDRTRFVIEVSDPMDVRVFTLSNPDRVVIDMPEVLWRLSGPQKPNGTGAVKSYRYGLYRPGDSRFVIDLNSPATASQPMILPPEGGYGYRVVVDLFPASQGKFDSSSGWPADVKAKDSEAEILASLTAPQTTAPSAVTPTHAKKVIVIDPGHGGVDSGTTAVSGYFEKDLVLDEGQRLARVLRARGYVVHMTRDSDIFIPLKERVNISRGYGADLFISLHADSNPDPGVSGASIYTLSEHGSDAAAAALAKRENQSDIIAGVDLTGQDDSVSHILIDLAQRDTINRSVRFAETAVVQLTDVTDILPREPHRSAGFVVLKAPDVPAVLIELGYLSNAQDCAQMETDRWRDRTANAIAAAVDRHFAPKVPGSPGPLAQTAE